MVTFLLSKVDKYLNYLELIFVFDFIFKVRQNPKIGAFYVQGLKFVAVGSYKEIEQRTEEGIFNMKLLKICIFVYFVYRIIIFLGISFYKVLCTKFEKKLSKELSHSNCK